MISNKNVFSFWLGLTGMFGMLPLLLPLAKGDDDLHPGLTFRRDFSKATNQFNLRKHLTAATPRDRRNGVENSRRLARNAIRLGIADEKHRELIPNNPPSGIIHGFDDANVLPSEGGRLKIEDNYISSTLPFGDGPGAFPDLPEGTKAFWEGNDVPTKMWEVIACPVADVEAFIENPLSCVFGYTEGSDDVAGSIMEFVGSLDGSQIEDAMINAVLPIASEFIYSSSIVGFFERILIKVCDILGIVDDIIGIADDIKDAIDSLGDWIEDAIDSLNPTNWFRQLSESEGGAATCTVHLSPCIEGDNESDIEACDDCFKTEGATCDSCKTCFQPLFNSVPEMDGICVGTKDLREFLLADAPPLITLQTIYTGLVGNFVRKNYAGQEIQALREVVDDVAAAIPASEEAVTGAISESQEAVTSAISDSQKKVAGAITKTCSAPAPAPSRRRLGEEGGTTDFLQSKQAREAKEFATKHGLSGKGADEAILKVFDSLSKDGDSFNEELKESILKDFSDPKKMEFVENFLKKNIDENESKYTAMMVGEVLKGSVNKETRRLDVGSLRETLLVLKDMKAARREKKKRPRTEYDESERRLDGFECGSGKGDLECGCLEVFYNLKTWVKENIVEPVLRTMIEELVTQAGSSSSFASVTEDPRYAGAFPPDVSNSPLSMPWGFILEFDPYAPGSALYDVRLAVTHIAYQIVGIFLYGNDCSQGVKDANGGLCGELPSMKNEVLPIKETRGGEIFMASGCDSEFEGELLLFKFSFELVEMLLDNGAEAVIEFFNIPIVVVKFILASAKMMFEHMDNVCSYLGGYVQGSFIEATFENSRFALQELACRAPSQLAKGHGCDGIDNTCDDDKQIDECAEDIFPPEISASNAITTCGEKIFPTSQDALDCFSAPGLVSAIDDCKEVDLTFEDKDASTCSAIIGIKATALGCGSRIDEDTTEIDVTVAIDSEKPEVTCELGTQDLEGKGYGDFADLDFSFTAVDECTDTDDLAVTIEVLSNEKVAIGDDMVVFSEPSSQDMLSIWAEDGTCYNSKSSAYGSCKISSPDKEKTRIYLVRVTATDKAGNVGVGECSTIVGKEKYVQQARARGIKKYPFFLASKLEIVGGMEPADELDIEAEVADVQPADELDIEAEVADVQPADELDIEVEVADVQPADELDIEVVDVGTKRKRSKKS